MTKMPETLYHKAYNEAITKAAYHKLQGNQSEMERYLRAAEAFQIRCSELEAAFKNKQHGIRIVK